MRYLIEAQQADGSWQALWFGNQYQSDQQSPTYATGRVLLAFRDLGRLDTTVARQGLDWLSAAQNDDGGWGARPLQAALLPNDGPGQVDSHQGKRWRQGDHQAGVGSPAVEETAAAVECLASCGRAAVHEAALARGLKWLSDAVEGNRHLECSPIGLDFAKLWYHEKLYPLVFTAAALGQSVRRRLPQSVPPSTVHLGKA